jgi:DNA-binding transcriptional MerR regulator
MAEPATTERYLQIGEAAERAHLTQRTLRYYEEKGLLKPPTRMEGGFRLYSQEDMQRIERIRELKDLLGFSLAEIKDMLEAEDIRLQIKVGWRTDADAAEKAAQIRRAREVTLHQIELIDQKMGRMAAMRNVLAERVKKHDEMLARWAESPAEPAAAGTPRTS